MLDMVLKSYTTTKIATYNFGNTTTTNTFDFSDWLNGATAGLVVLAIFAFLIVLAAIILIVISNCKIFSKAGEKWWKALIPMYNSWIETRISGLAWWWYLIFVVLTAITTGPKSNFILAMMLYLTSFNYCYCIAKKFGKSDGFAVLMSLLPFIGLPILAFGGAKYDSKVKVDKNGIFEIKK